MEIQIHQEGEEISFIILFFINFKIYLKKLLHKIYYNSSPKKFESNFIFFSTPSSKNLYYPIKNKNPKQIFVPNSLSKIFSSL